MNDFSDLEAELKQLRPRAASSDLEARVEASLADDLRATATAGVLPRRRRSHWSWISLGLGAAAAASLMMLAWLNGSGNPKQHAVSVAKTTPVARTIATNPPNTFVPDGLTRVVYHRRDEGLVFPRQANAPVRRVRSQARETLQWKEAATGASLRVSYPTEEVELIPVSGQ